MPGAVHDKVTVPSPQVAVGVAGADGLFAAAVVKSTSAILLAESQPLALYTSQVWAAPTVRLVRSAVRVLAATIAQVPASGDVFLCHQARVQLDRVSVAVVCVSEPAVRPTVEKVSLAISVVQPLSL